MRWIIVSLIFGFCFRLDAQVFFGRGHEIYRQVFIETDDFGPEYLDLLEESVEKISNDTLRLKILNDLGYYYHTRNLNKSLEIIDAGHAEAKRFGNRAWEGKFQVSQAAVLLRMEELDWAELLLNSAMEKLKENERWLLYTNLGYVFERRGDLGTAFEMATKTLQLGEKYDNQKAIAMAYSDLSNLFWKQGKFQVGYEYGLESIKIFEKIGLNDLDYNFTLYVIGNNLVALKKYDEALSCFKRSIKMGEQYGFYNNLSDNYIALAELYSLKGEFDKGEEAGLKAVKYAELLENNFMLIRSYLVLGKINNEAQHYKHAISFLEKSIEIVSDNFKDKYFLSLVYFELSKAYEGNSQYSKALKASRQYDSLKQTVFSVEADQRIATLQTQMDVDQKENRIIIQEAKLNQQKILQIFILTLTGLMVVFLFISYKNIAKKKKYSRLLEKQNLEKEYLLKEIHHRVKNNLETISSLLSLQTAKIENKELQIIMEETQNRVHSIGLIHQKLYQGNDIKSIEMRDFFTNLAKYIIDTFNASDRIDFRCDMEQIALDVDRAIPIGLIVNELLSNSIKYAFPEGRKGKINVSLSEKEDHLLLHVSDDGIGMSENPKIQGSGFGNQLIGLLTRQLEGKMTLIADSGTEINFEFQMHKAA